MEQGPAARVVATQAWFVKANDDLREAEFVLTANPPFIGSSLFHSEQAVEKAIKGFLTWHDQAFLTDDLEQQAEIAAALMGLPLEAVQSEVRKAGRTAARSTRVIAGEQGAQRSIVVERRVTRKFGNDKRVGS